MSVGDTSKTRPADPMEAFRAMRDAYLTNMAKTMADAVNTEGYAQANGAMLDNFLTVSAPFKEALDKSMLQALEQLSLPSRNDILTLAERFTNVEMRLDDMDSRMDEVVKLLTLVAAAAAQQQSAAATATRRRTPAKKVAKKAAKKVAAKAAKTAAKTTPRKTATARKTTK